MSSTYYSKDIEISMCDLLFLDPLMEDGGVDTTVIDRWQHKMGQMADFSPLFTSSIFDLYKHETPKIKSQAKAQIDEFS